MNIYRYSGYANSDVYRDENATGVFLAYGMNAVRLYDELNRLGEQDKGEKVLRKIIDVYPEYWQSYLLLGDAMLAKGDSAAPESLLVQLEDTLTSFLASNEENFFYRQDLGLTKVELGRQRKDQALIDDGIDLMWEAFRANMNNSYSFRKLVSVLGNEHRYADIQRAAALFANYKVNRNDPGVQQLLGLGSPSGIPVPPRGQ